MQCAATVGNILLITYWLFLLCAVLLFLLNYLMTIDGVMKMKTKVHLNRCTCVYGAVSVSWSALLAFLICSVERIAFVICNSSYGTHAAFCF